MQTLSAFAKGMLTRAGGEITESNSSSVGLAVKQYYNKQIQLHTLVQQTMSDVSDIRLVIFCLCLCVTQID